MMRNYNVTPCTLWEEKLAAIHPDDLSPIEREELEGHVASCSTCQITYNEFLTVDELIHTAYDGEQPLGLWKIFLDNTSHE